MFHFRVFRNYFARKPVPTQISALKCSVHAWKETQKIKRVVKTESSKGKPLAAMRDSNESPISSTLAQFFWCSHAYMAYILPYRWAQSMTNISKCEPKPPPPPARSLLFIKLRAKVLTLIEKTESTKNLVGPVDDVVVKNCRQNISYHYNNQFCSSFSNWSTRPQKVPRCLHKEVIAHL